jgi:Holliday junction DNA helicase RuvA
MIAYIDGKLTHKDPASVIIEAHGVGYEIKISLQTHAALSDGAERCRLFTYLAIREDAHVLYGFHDLDEKRLFLDLISVSGIGANTALVMLSSLSAGEIRQGILSENVRLIQNIKGIGPKTAQRVILELKDKLRKESLTLGLPTGPTGSTGGGGLRQDALAALTVMGIPRPVAERSIEAILKKDPDVTLEQLIKQALR